METRHLQTFDLPAGASVSFNAIAAPASKQLHRWSLELSPLSADAHATAPDGEGQVFGSDIGSGENQRIEIAGRGLDRRCHVWASHQTAEGWAPDVA